MTVDLRELINLRSLDSSNRDATTSISVICVRCTKDDVQFSSMHFQSMLLTLN